jgi:hypothetical protein
VKWSYSRGVNHLALEEEEFFYSFRVCNSDFNITGMELHLLT